MINIVTIRYQALWHYILQCRDGVLFSVLSCTLYLEKFMSTLPVRLPCLRNSVNVYMSSNNRNDSAYTEVPVLCFFIMQIGKIADIFPKKKTSENVPCANIRNCLIGCCARGVVIEPISSYWKVIATCAGS